MTSMRLNLLISSVRRNMRMLTTSRTVWTLELCHHRAQYPQPPCIAGTISHNTRLLHKQATSKICSILELEEHKDIREEIARKEEPGNLDTIVSAVLNKNIQVERVALENNVVVYKVPGSMTSTRRKDLPKNLDKRIMVGRFTAAENELIQFNWAKLKEEMNMPEKETVNSLFRNDKLKKTGLKLNIVGYYLSQGLPRPRLATEVIQRVRVLRCSTVGKFSTEEDDKILAFVETEGKKWAELARLLARTTYSTVQRRYEVLTGGRDVSGPFTVEEDKLILTEIFSANPDILRNRIITRETCDRIGQSLGRKTDQVYKHCQQTLLPVLLRHQAGILGTNIREVLLMHLVEQGVMYSQEVDWEELTTLPKFAGTTTAYLWSTYSSMVANTARKYPDLSSAELTTEMMLKYWDNREPTKGTEAMNESVRTKRDKHQEEIIEYYVDNEIGN